MFGALIDEPDVVQVELSSSAMKASLYSVLTYSGYSSDRKRKSKLTQFAPSGTLRSILSTEMSYAVSPRPATRPPPSSAVKLPEALGVLAKFTSPVVRIPKLEPFVGNELKLDVPTPSGVPFGGCVTNEAPVTSEGSAVTALAIVAASALEGPSAVSVRGADSLSRRGDADA